MDELIRVNNPEELLPLYDWKDCEAEFVCEHGNWRCTTSQFYQSSHCSFPVGEPEEGHTGNPLEWYVAPVSRETEVIAEPEVVTQTVIEQPVREVSQDVLPVHPWQAGVFALPVMVAVLWRLFR